MSISNLFIDNGYTIKCSELQCREFVAGDITAPDAVIDDLYTDRIRSGQSQNIVIRIGSLDAEFAGSVFPAVTETKNLGLINNRWNGVYAKDIDATGEVNIDGVLTVDNNANIVGACTASSLNVTNNSIFGGSISSGTITSTGTISGHTGSFSNSCSAGTLAVTTSSNLGGTTTCSDLNVNDLLTVNDLKFSIGPNQTELSNYDHINITNGLQVYGAVNISSVIRVNYSATRIGNMVCLTIDNFPEQPCFANNQPIIFGILDTWFVPPSGKSVSCAVQVQTNTGTIVTGQALIKSDGTVEVYSGQTINSFFTNGHQIGMGYFGTAFSLCYNV